MDYGSVSCSVAAEMTEDDGGVGAGRPCVYHIIPAGKWVTITRFEGRKPMKFVNCGIYIVSSRSRCKGPLPSYVVLMSG